MSVALAPSLSGLVAWSACGEANSEPLPPGVDYGSLVDAGPEIALPKGFQYASYAAGGSPMTDGTPTPAWHDGMACFPWTGAPGETLVRLVRNHEAQVTTSSARAIGDPAKAYDGLGPGGTSTLEFRLKPDAAPELLRSWMSLTGTAVNCAGGPTPWGSWLSCEETVLGTAHGLEQDHGYVFEVPVAANEPVEPVPLKAMGRFVHEAVAVDPTTQVVYLTEDQPRAGFYRFIPTARGEPMRAGSLRQGGRLQMLSLRGDPNRDTRRTQRTGVQRAVKWVDIANVDPTEHHPGAVSEQGFALGAARFSRLEGAWWGDSSVYFHATNGGEAELGQVWRYRPGADLSGGNADDGGTLSLVYESRSRRSLWAPDNITVSPRGGLILCEDASDACHLRGMSANGEIFPFAKNIMNDAEFAGACFSPDGRVLFVNIQGSGSARDPALTLAIWGPWERGAL